MIEPFGQEAIDVAMMTGQKVVYHHPARGPRLALEPQEAARRLEGDPSNPFVTLETQPVEDILSSEWKNLGKAARRRKRKLASREESQFAYAGNLVLTRNVSGFLLWALREV